MANHKTQTQTALFLLFSLCSFIATPSSASAQIEIFQDEDSRSAAITSLMSAVIDGDVEGVNFFIKSEPNSVNKKNLGGATALHIASRTHNPAIATALLDNNADVNAVDAEGWTPLMRASLAKDDQIVNILLAKGAKILPLNAFKESAIIHSAVSDCNECLSSIFAKLNIAQKDDEEKARKQINDAFIIAKKHNNKEAQEILGTGLDGVIAKTKEVKLDKSKSKMQKNDLAAVAPVENKIIDVEFDVHEGEFVDMSANNQLIDDADYSQEGSDQNLEKEKSKGFWLFNLFSKKDQTTRNLGDNESDVAKPQEIFLEKDIMEANDTEELDEVENNVEEALKEEVVTIDISKKPIEEEVQKVEGVKEREHVKQKQESLAEKPAVTEAVVVEEVKKVEEKKVNTVEVKMLEEKTVKAKPETVEVLEKLVVVEKEKQVVVSEKAVIAKKDKKVAERKSNKSVDEEAAEKIKKFKFKRGPSVLPNNLVVSEPPHQKFSSVSEGEPKAKKSFLFGWFSKDKNAGTQEADVKKNEPVMEEIEEKPVKKFKLRRGGEFDPNKSPNIQKFKLNKGLTVSDKVNDLEEVILQNDGNANLTKNTSSNRFRLISKKKEFSIVE